MFCGPAKQHLPGLAMTITTGLIRSIVGVGNLEGLVGWMTFQALIQSSLHGPHFTGVWCCPGMLLVALQATGDGSVFSVMAGGAVKIRMSGLKGVDVLAELWVANVTALGEWSRGRYVQGHVCLDMTAAAVDELFSMLMTVTA